MQAVMYGGGVAVAVNETKGRESTVPLVTALQTRDLPE
jgi:hypothetical protein